MGNQENEKSQEMELIDITGLLSDYFRIFRKIGRASCRERV